MYVHACGTVQLAPHMLPLKGCHKFFVPNSNLSPAKHSQLRHVQSWGTLTAGMLDASRHALLSHTMSYHHLERLPVISEVSITSFGGCLSCRSEDRKIARDVVLRSTLDEHICQSGNISHQEMLLRVAQQVQKSPVAISSPTRLRLRQEHQSNSRHATMTQCEVGMM